MGFENHTNSIVICRQGNLMSEVDVKTLEPMDVMSKSFTGSYNQTMDRLDELMSWLLRVGHPYSSAPRAVFYDDPDEVPEDELRAKVCLPIKEDSRTGFEIDRDVLEGGDFACLLYEGPYDGIAGTYSEIYQWMEENGYHQKEDMGVREVYRKIIGQVESTEELVTEVQVPIQSVTESLEEEAPEEIEEPAAP